MFNANANSHYKTLKGWTKSAEFNRAMLKQQENEIEPPKGVYKVRLKESGAWQLMKSPPAEGACEWLYINSAGVPIYYWNKEQDGLTII